MMKRNLNDEANSRVCKNTREKELKNLAYWICLKKNEGLKIRKKKELKDLAYWICLK